VARGVFSVRHDKNKNSFFVHSLRFARLVRKVDPEDFAKAQSYLARDKISRLLAAECYALAAKFRDEGKEKLALQYMKLATKLLGLSLRPKRLSDLDQIKRALKELKAEKADDS
jgi:hypothetical protein